LVSISFFDFLPLCYHYHVFLAILTEVGNQFVYVEILSVCGVNPVHFQCNEFFPAVVVFLPTVNPDDGIPGACKPKEVGCGIAAETSAII